MIEEKAQINLEYMLVIAGAVVVVTIVAIFIKNTATTVGDSVQDTAKKP